MLHLLVRDRSNHRYIQGFTLIEISVVLAMIGVLIALATPSILATYARTKLLNSVEKLNDILDLSQVKAVQTNKKCRVYIPNNTQIVSECITAADNTSFSIAGVPDGLPLVTLDNGITMTNNFAGSPPTIAYNFKGITQAVGTIVLSSNQASLQKCLTIDSGVGLTRIGTYVNNICELIQ
ncbi:MAG: prepilin-type N-terminal cleavage/methylation domain-containing protein [Chamaesiphon sp.]|nr:prepilin-type N-terminal cleavage/methylation domain-containing protein [Chamaesiphon sp.]